MRPEIDGKGDPGGGEPRQQADHPVRRWKLGDILGEGREAIVEHAGQEYRLRLTAKNRLILTK